MAELKPCPFCGEVEDTQLHNNGWDLWSVSCAECLVKMEDTDGGFSSKEVAIEAWNKRPI